MFRHMIFLIFFVSPFSAVSAEKLVFALQCSWDNLDSSSENQKQIFKLYKDGKEQRLEITPVEEAVPTPTYFLKKEGSYTNIGKNEYFKEYYWQSSDIRLTLLRGNNTLIKVESISDPAFPELTATCPKPVYKN